MFRKIGLFPSSGEGEDTHSFRSLINHWKIYVGIITAISQSKLCYDRRSVGQSVLVSSMHLGPKARFYYCQTVAGLLMWGALSDERKGLSFTIASDPRQRSLFVYDARWTHDHVLLSQVRDSRNLEGHVPYLYPPGTGWPSNTPRHWVLFLSLPTIRRATVEVFGPASTRDN
jgi:hypothetical protein